MNSHGASLSELKDVLMDTLEARGSLGQIKARIRAEIFLALDEQIAQPPQLSNENLVINELIREYLEYNGYRHTLSVFLPESCQPLEKPFEREYLSSQLNIGEDERFKHIPLLYSILSTLKSQRHKGPEESKSNIKSITPEKAVSLEAAPITVDNVKYIENGESANA